MPQTLQYPDPTPQQFEKADKIRPIMLDGSEQVEDTGIGIVGCIDTRPHSRTLAGKAMDHAERFIYDPAYLQQLHDISGIVYDNDANEHPNMKVRNILRRRHGYTPYFMTEAGGRYAQSIISEIVTTMLAGTVTRAIFCTDHEDCTAAKKGNQLSWNQAIPLIMHDLWKFNVDNPVNIFTATTTIGGTELVNVNHCTKYDFEAYDQLVRSGGSFDITVPDEATGFSKFEVPTLAAADDAGAVYRQHQMSCLQKGLASKSRLWLVG